MKNLKFIALTLTGALALAGCQQPETPTPAANVAPVVNFNIQQATSTSKEVTFTDASTDADGAADLDIAAGATYEWDFGDNTAKVKNVKATTHTYAASGKYNVTLTVTDKGNNTRSHSRDVVVQPVVDPGNQDVDMALEASGGEVTTGQTMTKITVKAKASKKANVQGKLTKIEFTFNNKQYVTELNTEHFNDTITVEVPNSVVDRTYIVTVTATDTNGKTKETQASIKVSRVGVIDPTPNPGAYNGTNVGIHEASGATWVNQPRVGLNADNSDPENVVRNLGVLSGGVSGIFTYAKGQVCFSVKPTRVLPEGVTVNHVDYRIIDTSIGTAIAYVGDVTTFAGDCGAGGPTGNFMSKPFDTAQFSHLEGKKFRIVAQITYSEGMPEVQSHEFIVDRTAPQSADPQFVGAPVSKFTASNILTNFNGVNNNNWARGTIYTYVSNGGLLDLPQSVPGDTLPSGLERIEYYLVPADVNGGVPAGVQDGVGNEPNRVKNIRTLGVKVAYKEDRGTAPYNWRAVASTGVSVPVVGSDIVADAKDIADGRYYLFAITRDELGNSRGSTSYEQVTFDNKGPKLTVGKVYDTSPLPYVAENGYISDHARIDGIVLEDFGGKTGVNYPVAVGFPGGLAANVSFACQSFPVSGFAVGQTRIPPKSGTFLKYDFDSNACGDGPYSVSVLGAGGSVITDILGNPATVDNPASAVIDNIDPSLDMSSPAGAFAYRAGQDVPIEANASDSTSGLASAFSFWSDSLWKDKVSYRSRANGFIGAPVEIRRGTALNDNLSNALNSRWRALFPGYDNASGFVFEGLQRPMNVGIVAIDKAGNATMRTRSINVSAPRAGIVGDVAPMAPCPTDVCPTQESVPSMGNIDVHAYTAFPSFYTPGFRGLFGIGVNSTPIFEKLVTDDATRYQVSAEMKVAGTNPDLTGSTGYEDRIADEDGVVFYRQGGTASWYRTKLWQVCMDPTIDKNDGLHEQRKTEWTSVDSDPSNQNAMNPSKGMMDCAYYALPGSGYNTVDTVNVINAVDTTYNVGNGEGLQSPYAPWFRFDGTTTSSTIHRADTGFDSVFNPPEVIKSGANYIYTVPAVMPSPVVLGNVINVVNQPPVRLYNPAIKNPSTTAIGAVVTDQYELPGTVHTTGLYNFTFESMNFISSPRIDGTKISPVGDAAPTDYGQGGDR
ncbi:MAG: PKD domain-containing protein [Deinococcaceae bacterium]